MLSRLGDFITFSACFNIQSEGSISQLLELCRKIKFGIYVHQTLINTKVSTMLRLGDFMTCNALSNIPSEAPYLRFGTLWTCSKKKFSTCLSYTHIHKL